MHIVEFCNRVEEIIHEQVKSNFPYDWDEDFITRSVLREFRNKFNKVQVHGLENTIKIEWSVYKFTGKPERKFGDVALLINIQYQDGDKVEGVGFLEAKKRDKNKTQFNALKLDQLKRIYRSAAQSMVLLYDYDDIAQFALSKILGWCWYAWTPFTNSVVVPTNMVLATKKKDTSLYKFSLPFSYQLCFRYFYGFDLEFQEETIKIAKGYAEKVPKYLLVISITHGKIEPSRELDFNGNVFRELE